MGRGRGRSRRDVLLHRAADPSREAGHQSGSHHQPDLARRRRAASHPMKRILRVLIVEDAEDDATMLVDELRRGGFDVRHTLVQTAEGMRAALDQQTWDVVVSDYSMPQFTGLEALSVLKASGLDVPLIIASGTIGEETAVEALKAGACDFFLKDRLGRLVPAIAREMREVAGRQAKRNLELAFAETRERMQFALEAAGVGVWESEIASGSATWSDVMEQLHGLPVGGFGSTIDAFVECIHPDDRQAVLGKIAQATRERADSRLEYRTTWPDGSTHWISRIGRTFYNETGEPIRAAGVGMDITAQKNLEDQYRQAQKLESIGSLAAGIAHDFNNLLTIVTGYCELLAARFAGDKTATGDLDEIRRAGTSATALTRQLLAFSRRQILALRVLDLNTILTDSQRMMRRLVEESVRIQLRLAEDLSPVTVDAGQVEQVLLNLVINARDAMPDGGVVTIETQNVVLDEADARMHMDVQPGSYVLLSVADTGSGMSPDVQAQVFEPFFTTKERGRGTGLGLSTVYGIVKQSGGHIWVESEVGAGTTFRIYLPVATDADLPVTAVPRASSNVLNGAETILVVDDEPSLRALTKRILQRYGYTVLLAANGEEAQRISRSHRGPIGVALMDVVLPGCGGRAVAEWITSQRPETRIVYMSGYTYDAITPNGMLDPGTTLVQKPFTPETLIGRIREALS
ncbi:MAG: response regulator [Luteitalea sp.]|nr:response regulator [Luteitalea sp.]